MLETGVILAFIGALAVCIVAGASVLWALAVGYLLFFGYALARGHRPGDVFRMSFKGVRTVRNILLIFGLIGFITALWRGAGTIPVIVCWSAGLVSPGAFILITFLLNCMVSVLTGTSFGTGATMGVICMAMANAMKIDPFWVGGAILSGVYFGDRCSPVSSSANLVCQLTGTDIFDNIKGMIRTTLVPFFLTCLFYYGIGLTRSGGGGAMDVEAVFSGSFSLHWAAVVPAAAILVLSAFKVEVKKTMVVSIALSIVLCLTLQGVGFLELLKMVVFGYRAQDPALAAMMDGGGLLSMVKVAVIVSLSSCYAGIFEGTGLLRPLQARIEKLARRITPFGCLFLIGTLTSMIACNQSLATILTHQLCQGSEPDRRRLALDLENTVIVLAPLVPWSIAGTVPLAAVGAPMASMAAACYLYLVPLWNLGVNLAGSSRDNIKV